MRWAHHTTEVLVAVLIGCAVAAFAPPANAFVVQVATSIPTEGIENDTDLGEAVYSAIKDVMKQAIAFTPSLVELRSAKRVGDRLYLLLLLADPDGEEALKAFEAMEPDAGN